MDTTKFKTIRKGQGITIKELSEKTGIDRSLISLIENGKANPTLKTISKLADALKIQIILSV